MSVATIVLTVSLLLASLSSVDSIAVEITGGGQTAVKQKKIIRRHKTWHKGQTAVKQKKIIRAHQANRPPSTLATAQAGSVSWNINTEWGGSCDQVCARLGSTCSQDKLDGLGLSSSNMTPDVLKDAFERGSNGTVTCARWNTGCKGGNCENWGLPFIHSSHFNDNICWGGDEVAPCNKVPVDGHHKRLCPCYETQAPEADTAEPTPAPSPAPAPAAPSVSTTSTEAVAAGATVMQASTAGFKVGGTVDIDLGTAVHEVNTIQAFGSFTFANPLQFAHAAGAVISEAPTTEADVAPIVEAPTTEATTVIEDAGTFNECNSDGQSTSMVSGSTCSSIGAVECYCTRIATATSTEGHGQETTCCETEWFNNNAHYKCKPHCKD